MKKVRLSELITVPVRDEFVTCPCCGKPLRLSFNEQFLAEPTQTLTPIEQLKRDYVYAVEKPNE